MKIDDMPDDDFIALFSGHGERLTGRIIGKSLYGNNEYLICKTENLENPINVVDARALNGQSVPISEAMARAVIEEFYEKNPELESPELPDNIYELTDEEGNEISLELLDIIEHNSKEYVVFIPNDHVSTEVMIFEVHKNGLEQEYLSLDNEEDFTAIFNLFVERNEELFDFVD